MALSGRRLVAVVRRLTSGPSATPVHALGVPITVPRLLYCGFGPCWTAQCWTERPWASLWPWLAFSSSEQSLRRAQLAAHSYPVGSRHQTRSTPRRPAPQARWQLLQAKVLFDARLAAVTAASADAARLITFRQRLDFIANEPAAALCSSRMFPSSRGFSRPNPQTAAIPKSFRYSLARPMRRLAPSRPSCG